MSRSCEWTLAEWQTALTAERREVPNGASPERREVPNGAKSRTAQVPNGAKCQTTVNVVRNSAPFGTSRRLALRAVCRSRAPYFPSFGGSQPAEIGRPVE